jgi:hypothetical protein
MNLESVNLGSIVYLTLAAIAAVYSALLTLQAYEFRRFSRARAGKRNGSPPPGRVLLVCPCRGAEPNLAENLRPLFAQDHGDYHLVFVVDNFRDPASRPIRRLMRENSQVDARLIVAGAATDSGQKVHNLLAATADLSDDVKFLAFVDSDARPPADWLRQLIQRLDQPGVAAATAYRWLVPRSGNLPNSLVHALDAGVASLVGPGKHHLVWGGSWAVRRDAFESADLRSAWRGTLSDDLVAARVLRSVGRVEFEPGAMVASEVNLDRRRMFEFVRRQFTIGRFYAPVFWGLAAALSCLQQATVWIGVALTPVAWLSGGWTAIALAAALLIYALQVLRGWLREDAARHFLPEAYRRTAAARRTAVWCGPLVGGLQCWGLLTALVNRRIGWRGIEYVLSSGGQMQIVNRRSAPKRRARRRAIRRTSVEIRAIHTEGLPPQCNGPHTARLRRPDDLIACRSKGHGQPPRQNFEI